MRHWAAREKPRSWRLPWSATCPHAGIPANVDASSYSSDPAAKSAGAVPAASTADKSFQSVSSRAADAADPAASLHGNNFIERWHSALDLLKERLAYLKNGKLLLDGTVPGPGRVDAFGAARNLLFPKSYLRMQSPVSFPFIWDVPDNRGKPPTADTAWIHYDGNTNSILERNIGQALGMGAVFDPQTYQSTLRIENLQQLETLTHKLQAPKWRQMSSGRSIRPRRRPVKRSSKIHARAAIRIALSI